MIEENFITSRLNWSLVYTLEVHLTVHVVKLIFGVL